MKLFLKKTLSDPVDKLGIPFVFPVRRLSLKRLISNAASSCLPKPFSAEAFIPVFLLVFFFFGVFSKKTLFDPVDKLLNPLVFQLIICVLGLSSNKSIFRNSILPKSFLPAFFNLVFCIFFCDFEVFLKKTLSDPVDKSVTPSSICFLGLSLKISIFDTEFFILVI